jgi:hypothetical protein
MVKGGKAGVLAGASLVKLSKAKLMTNLVNGAKTLGKSITMKNKNNPLTIAAHFVDEAAIAVGRRFTQKNKKIRKQKGGDYDTPGSLESVSLDTPKDDSVTSEEDSDDKTVEKIAETATVTAAAATAASTDKKSFFSFFTNPFKSDSDDKKSTFSFFTDLFKKKETSGEGVSGEGVSGGKKSKTLKNKRSKKNKSMKK